MSVTLNRTSPQFRHTATPIVDRRRVDAGWIVLCSPSPSYPKWSTHFACVCADGKLGLFFTELHNDSATATNRYAERT